MLEYGFNTKDAAKIKAGQEIFDSFSKEEKDFFHNHLPWILVFVEVGVVNLKTIPIITNRLAVFNKVLYTEIVKSLNLPDWASFESYLHKFVGYSANVATTTTTQFIASRAKVMKRDLIPLSKKEVEAIYKSL